MEEVLTADEVAREAGVDLPLVRRLTALGILKPASPDRFEPGDIVRVETIQAFVEAGIALDEIAAAVAAGDFTFDYIHLFYTPMGRRSERRYENFAASLGPRSNLLPAVYAAMGLPEPRSQDHLRTEEEELIADLFEAWEEAGDEETYVRATRIAGEAARLLSEGWVRLFVERISDPVQEAGADVAEVIEVILRSGPRVARLAPRLLLWLQQRHLRHAMDAANVDGLEAALAERGFSPPRPERLPTMAFVDLSGYTQLTEERGDEVAVRSTSLLRERSEEAARRHAGSLVKLLGDGAMLHFRDANGAVVGALELVSALGAADLTAHAGLHAGPLIERDGDYFGRTVNVASRVAGRAKPGEVLVTEAVVSAVGTSPVSFDAAGEEQLKGVAEPVRLFRARSETL